MTEPCANAYSPTRGLGSMVIVGEWRKRDDRTQCAAVPALVGGPAGVQLAEYFLVDSRADRNQAEFPISSIQVALLLVPQNCVGCPRNSGFLGIRRLTSPCRRVPAWHGSNDRPPRNRCGSRSSRRCAACPGF